MKRPDAPQRISSFTKRHASFDSPREIPLPSPSIATTAAMRDGPVFAVDDEPDADWELISPGGAKLHKDKKGKDKDKPAAAPSTPPVPPPAASKLQKETILPYSRPYSLPGGQSYHGRSPSKEMAVPPGPPSPGVVDRTSSASLPLPMQIHFSALPKAAAVKQPSIPSPVHERTPSDLQLRPPQPHRSSGTRSGSGSAVTGSSRSSNASSDSLLSAPDSASPSPRLPTPRLPTSQPPSAPRPPTTSLQPPAPSSHSRVAPSPASPTSVSSPPSAFLSSSTSSTASSSSHRRTSPAPYPRLPAPMPPPDELTPSPSGAAASYRPPRTTFTPAPPDRDYDLATAIGRSPSLRSVPPPEPPVILPTPDGMKETPLYGLGSHASGSGSPTQNQSKNAAASSSSSRGGGPSAFPSSSSSSPQNINNRTSASSSNTNRSSTSSYEPFLPHAPPPVDCWIEVETTAAEYRLVVRLPGFKRDGITLATKKRRILHVSADSWEEGGGHFERRISFGYDADLAQVRAEFDGELLRVVIPRKNIGGMGVGAAGAWGGGVGGGGGGGAGGGESLSPPPPVPNARSPGPLAGGASRPGVGGPVGMGTRSVSAGAGPGVGMAGTRGS
ncbi:hypothetical protein R3P38DRAFT_3214820 [Favolaschia claudopus]|uniref:SHSP domain-containing protein n=1 Tax=Favolaschia claudopus TaxID=2862362 RepID=A0AAW0A9U8_9AGAR